MEVKIKEHLWTLPAKLVVLILNVYYDHSPTINRVTVVTLAADGKHRFLGKCHDCH